MSIFISSKLPNAGTTIFTTISSLAVQHRAINLGQGFPDYPMSAELVDLVTQAMQQGHNQYTHANGLPELRQALVNKIQLLYGQSYHEAHHITVTPGGTYGIYTTITACIQPKDEVIILEPAYDCYAPAVELCGGIVKRVAINPTNWDIDFTALEASITPATKMLIINNPHNPSGKVFSAAALDEVERIVLAHNLILLADEVYEHLVFPGGQHHSVLGRPLLAQNSMVCFSLGKTYNCTGWKLGYVVSKNEQLMNEFRKVHQFNCFSVNTPLQVAFSQYVQQPKPYQEIGGILHEKQQLLQRLISQTGLEPMPCQGGYFQTYSYKNLSEASEMDFVTQLITQYGVAAIPVSAFYGHPTENGLIRFCFAKKNSTLQAAAERLQKLGS